MNLAQPLWMPDCMIPDGGEGPCRGYQDLKNDLNESLKAVLHFWGPEGAEQVTRHILAARRSRESNATIDDLERLFASDPHSSGQ
jgi:hypothetical protein